MDIEVLHRSLAREKAQRNKAEQLLEDKSRELYHSYEELRRSHDELEQVHAAVKLKQDQLVQSEKMASLGILAAGVAHEINNPLAFVFSNINSLSHAAAQFKACFQLIEDQVLSCDELLTEEKRNEIKKYVHESDIVYLLEDCEELVEETVEGVERVKGIVAGLQTFARVDGGDMEEIELNQCVRNTIKIASGKLKTGCNIEERLGELPKIKGYPGKLGQVVLNLLVNASQAVAENGRIVVSTEHCGSAVKLLVEDNGCGMPREVVDNIFTPFFTTKPVGSGTGLGLSVSHGIVVEHKGSISVRSEAGCGTCFTVSLPVDHSSLDNADFAA